MTYAYSHHTGELIRTDVIADWMGTTDVAPPVFDALAAGCFWRGDRWEIVSASTSQPVPQAVSRFQARAALHNAGLFSQVEAVMTEPDVDPLARFAWTDAQEFRRESPNVIAIAARLGLTGEQLDDLFVAAAQIEA